MAKKSGHGGKRPGAGRPKKERDDVAVKMDRRMAAKAYFVAKAKGISIAEYLDGLGPAIDRDFLRLVGGGK